MMVTSASSHERGLLGVADCAHGRSPAMPMLLHVLCLKVHVNQAAVHLQCRSIGCKALPRPASCQQQAALQAKDLPGPLCLAGQL